MAKNGKFRVFELKSRDGTVLMRQMDDFYIRSGESKKLLETHKQVCQYVRNNFPASPSGMI